MYTASEISHPFLAAMVLTVRWTRSVSDGEIEFLRIVSTLYREGLETTRDAYDRFVSRLPVMMRAQELTEREMKGYTYVDDGRGLSENVLQPFQRVAVDTVRGILNGYMSAKQVQTGRAETETTNLSQALGLSINRSNAASTILAVLNPAKVLTALNVVVVLSVLRKSQLRVQLNYMNDSLMSFVTAGLLLVMFPTDILSADTYKTALIVLVRWLQNIASPAAEKMDLESLRVSLNRYPAFSQPVYSQLVCLTSQLPTTDDTTYRTPITYTHGRAMRESLYDTATKLDSEITRQSADKRQALQLLATLLRMWSDVWPTRAVSLDALCGVAALGFPKVWKEMEVSHALTMHASELVSLLTLYSEVKVSDPLQESADISATVQALGAAMNSIAVLASTYGAYASEPGLVSADAIERLESAAKVVED